MLVQQQIVMLLSLHSVGSDVVSMHRLLLISLQACIVSLIISANLPKSDIAILS